MNYRNDNRSGGGRGFNRGGYGNDRGEDRQMFSTRCASCGQDCEVPFKPNGSKPVYCNNCFRTMGGNSENRSDDRGSRRSYGEDRGSSQGMSQEQFATLNAKLDKILQLLSKDAPQKPAKASKPKHVEEADAPSVQDAPIATEQEVGPESDDVQPIEMDAVGSVEDMVQAPAESSTPLE